MTVLRYSIVIVSLLPIFCSAFRPIFFVANMPLIYVHCSVVSAKHLSTYCKLPSDNLRKRKSPVCAELVPR